MTLSERQAPLAALRRAFELATTVSGRVVVIAGGVAVGKSALAQEFLESVGSPDIVRLAAVASRGECGHTLGTVRQLLQEAPLDALTARRVDQLLVSATAWGGRPAGTSHQAAVHTIHELCRVLLDLAARRPVVISVDDVNHADPASLQCLLYLARRLRSARVLMVLNEPVVHAAHRVAFHAELARRPDHRRIHLAPLSPTGTGALLAEHLPASAVGRLCTEAFEVSGGNPLLVRALADDQDPARHWGRLTVGSAFREAFVTCLFRCEPEFFAVAHALAVLGDDAGRVAVGRLAGVDADTVGYVLDVLSGSGLLRDGRFRHPEARGAVLRCSPRQSRLHIYGRAAEILHEEGAGPADVAQRLVAAATPPPTWAVPVLAEAAHQALGADDPQVAVQYLRLAHQAEVDEGERVGIQAALAEAEWQVDPATAARHLTDLVAAAHGHLAPRCAPVAAQHLAWQGSADDAVTTLAKAMAGCADAGPDATAALRRAAQYVGYLFPGTTPPRPHGGEPGRPGTDDTPSAFATVCEVLRGTRTEVGIADTEQELRRCDGINARLDTTVAWLESLLYTDSLDRAEHWSSVILAQADRRPAPARQALFAGVRAEVSFRRGDLRTAATLARTALDQLSPRGWGVAIGGPLSTLVLSATAMGHYDEAAALLIRPTPPAMMRTPYGVRYLYARGRYHLATDGLHEALADFRSCGEMMSGWNMDQPALAPWRTDAAVTLLHLGDTDQARELAEEQLRRSTGNRTRSRALLLRALAMTGSAQRSTGLLTEAAEIFEECGDRLELAYTLTSLGLQTQWVFGDPAQGRMMLHRADRMARECGAKVVQRRVLPHRPRSAPPYDLAARLAELSEAERRVAVLAARGMTNREISARLFVTMSTVEQHLTRIYRKLAITSRSDLPRELRVEELAHSA